MKKLFLMIVCALALSTQVVNAQEEVVTNALIIQLLDEGFSSDEIIGFISRTQGVSIHRKSCENVRKSLENPEEAGKWIKVSWQNGTKNRYSTDIKIESKTRIGGYVEILNIFANMKINVSKMNVRDEIDGRSIFYLTVDVTGVEQLELAMSRVRKTKGVLDVYRKFGEADE